MSNFHLSHTKKAFTLLEALIGIAILILVGLAAVFFQGNIFSLHTILDINFGNQQQARRVLKLFVAEVRSAAPSSAGAFPILSAATSSFTFYADINNDGLYEQVRYFISGTTLQKGVINPTGNPAMYATSSEVITTVVRDVANGTTSAFEYYPSTYSGTSSPLAYPIDPFTIRLVKLTIIIDRVANRPPEPLTLTTQVSLRNLKDNL